MGDPVVLVSMSSWFTWPPQLPPMGILIHNKSLLPVYDVSLSGGVIVICDSGLVIGFLKLFPGISHISVWGVGRAWALSISFWCLQLYQKQPPHFPLPWNSQRRLHRLWTRSHTEGLGISGRPYCSGRDMDSWQSPTYAMMTSSILDINSRKP